MFRSNRNIIIRSLHDLGAAAWFGGALMGAVGVNGAAAAVREPPDRARVASAGWSKWSPVNKVSSSVPGGSWAGLGNTLTHRGHRKLRSAA